MRLLCLLYFVVWRTNIYTRALLPDLIRFAYIPRDELRINAETENPSLKDKKDRARSPDFSAFTIGGSSAGFSHSTPHEEEHVLVLDFAAAKGSAKKPDLPSCVLTYMSKRVLTQVISHKLCAPAPAGHESGRSQEAD